MNNVFLSIYINIHYGFVSKLFYIYYRTYIESIYIVLIKLLKDTIKLWS